MKRDLILYIPVLHKGYLDVLKKQKDHIAEVYLIENAFLQELTGLKPDIAAFDIPTTQLFLKALGIQNVSLFSKEGISSITSRKILLIQDEVSRNLYERYLRNADVEWLSVFLRWDRDSILTEMPVDDILISDDPLHREMIKRAYTEAQKSSDWWRQVGAVLVRDGKSIATAYNQGVPSDHTAYQVGAIRDLLKPGEKPELVNYIHAEQKIIAEAAKSGIPLDGSSLYLTHFPCPVCAKLIAYAGIQKLYFSEGSSALDGRTSLESANVELIRCKE